MSNIEIRKVIKLINEGGVAELTAIKEGKVNMRRSVTIKHSFGNVETHATTRRRKTQRWLLCTYKKRRRNCMKGKIYLKQLLLKNTFGKGLLVVIKEVEVYKLITNKEFKDETDSPFKKVVPGEMIERDLWGSKSSNWNLRKTL